MSKSTLQRILIGAVAPMLIYYVGHKMGRDMAGAVIASVWGMVVMGWVYCRSHELDGFAAIGAAYSVAGLAGLLVTKDPDWYLYSPIVSDVVLGGVFLVSMVLRRPLIQVLAEQAAGKYAFPDQVRKSGYYRSLWFRLSLCWGGVYVLRGLVSWFILVSFPVEVFLTAQVVLGWPVVGGMIAFSFWYPKRYWGQRVAV